MKKIIAIFFLFIISLQCLPVKELGKALFDNTFTEEEMCKKGIDKKDVPDSSKEFYLNLFASHLIAEQSVSLFFRHSVDLLAAPVTDVTTPPPNVFT